MSEENIIYLPKFVAPVTCYNNTDHILSIKKSQIKKAGNGIYSYERLIKEGEIIGYYEGKLTKSKAGECVGDYSFELNKHWYIDARDYPRAYTAMINDAYSSKFTNNCEFVLINHDENGKKLVGKNMMIALQAMRDIHFGEELFASYGEPYWECESRKH